MVYWAGDLFLFLGTPTGYRLVVQDFRGLRQRLSRAVRNGAAPFGPQRCESHRKRGDAEYNLVLEGSAPRFTATPIESGGERDVGAYPDQIIPEDW
jgi:hypothetical protein